jgi:glycosyltransferase involved in cell wall biosynthesis
MKVSVVTVVYNAAETIEDTIKSVIAQDYENIEHIVIDGGSTDDTMDVVNRYREHLAVVVSEPDDGIYDAMNKGIDIATGDIVGTLNADDWYADNGVIRKVVIAFNEDNKLDAVYGDIIFVTREKPYRHIRYWKSRPYKDGLFKKGWMPPHPTFFVKKEIYLRYGKYDVDLKIQSDFDLTMRFLMVNRIKTQYLPGIMVNMRIGGVTSNSISNVIKGNLEAFRACRKNGLAVTPFFMARKVFSRIPQFFHKP